MSDSVAAIGADQARVDAAYQRLATAMSEDIPTPNAGTGQVEHGQSQVASAEAALSAAEAALHADQASAPPAAQPPAVQQPAAPPDQTVPPASGHIVEIVV